MIKLVIADDLEEIRSYLSEEITRCSQDISVVGLAQSGSEAIKLVRKLRPDVVLMDIQMETLTAGIDAIEIIHKEFPNIKCITLSIHKNDDYLFRAYMVGASDYIVKTNSPEQIVKSIHDVVENTLLLRPEVAQKILTEYQRVQESQARMKETLQIVMKISTAEYEILKMVYDGYTYKNIAKQRFVQETTIRSQVNHILKKFKKKRMKDVISLLHELNFFENF